MVSFLSPDIFSLISSVSLQLPVEAVQFIEHEEPGKVAMAEGEIL
jgi:hypothetical protein